MGFSSLITAPAEKKSAKLRIVMSILLSANLNQVLHPLPRDREAHRCISAGVLTAGSVDIGKRDPPVCKRLHRVDPRVLGKRCVKSVDQTIDMDKMALNSQSNHRLFRQTRVSSAGECFITWCGIFIEGSGM